MISHLLFDLDNTLYPETAAMNQGITRRMLVYTAGFLGVTYDEAVALRRQRLPLYGTTLEWLRNEHGLTDVSGYFNAVHPPEEVDELQPDPDLRTLLLSLGLPMTVLTNAPRCHAERVLEFLNVADIFTGVYDVERNNLRGKPYPEAYLNAISGAGSTVAETVFFDDHKKYTDGYERLGGRAVLVRNPDVAPAAGQLASDGGSETGDGILPVPSASCSGSGDVVSAGTAAFAARPSGAGCTGTAGKNCAGSGFCSGGITRSSSSLWYIGSLYDTPRLLEMMRREENSSVR